jgi:hypothetical protein
MRPVIRKCLLLAASVLAAGCTAMSESECRSTNWSDLGEREALIYGQRPQIELYAHQCGKHGVQPSEPEYMAGWVYGQGERIRRSSGEGCCSPN